MLHHYIVVRRDLPLGATLAHVAHAAGESFYQMALNVHPDYAPPTPDTTVVVLGARNEARLQKLERDLLTAGIAHVAFRETEGTWAGQMTAIGLVPTTRETVRPYVSDFNIFPSTADYE